jgi:hypothetical protein
MIREKCSCGAEITVEYRETAWQTATVNKWRKEHQHEVKVRNMFINNKEEANDDFAPRKNYDYVTIYPLNVEAEDMCCGACGAKFELIVGFDSSIFKDKIEIIHRGCPKVGINPNI